MKRALAALGLCLFIGVAPAARRAENTVASAPAGRPDAVVEAAVMKCLADMPDHQYFIGHREIVDKLLAGEPMLIVDIRQPDAYAKGHLRGAVNLPFGPVLAQSLGRLPRAGEVFVYCYSGQSSAQTVMLLNALGVPARSVTYGWNLGISKVEGAAAVTVSEPSELSADQACPTTPSVLEACEAYYDQLIAGRGTRFAGNMIGEADAKALLDAKDGTALFVATQSPEEFAKGRIEGALNIPWGKGVDRLVAGLPKDKKLVVYCGSGQRSGLLVAALRLMGLDAVSLRNGLGTPGNYPAGWVAKGYSLVQ